MSEPRAQKHMLARLLLIRRAIHTPLTKRSSKKAKFHTIKAESREACCGGIGANIQTDSKDHAQRFREMRAPNTLTAAQDAVGHKAVATCRVGPFRSPQSNASGWLCKSKDGHNEFHGVSLTTHRQSICGGTPRFPRPTLTTKPVDGHNRASSIRFDT